MKNLTLLTLFIGLTSSYSNAQSTIINGLGDKAKEKAQQKDFNSKRNNKDMNMLDKSKSAPASADSTSQVTESPTVNMVASETNYVFSSNMTYEITDKKKEKSTIKYSFGQKSMLVVVGDKMETVYDWKNETMIMLDNEKKSGMVLPARWMTKITKEVSKDTTIIVKATGNKKMILGYNCEEYEMIDKKERTLVWVTKEITIDAAEYYRAILSKQSKEMEQMEGVMMEMTAFNKKNEEEMHMIMTLFSKEGSSKDLSGYTITNPF